LKYRATTIFCPGVDSGHWFFLLNISLGFWYDAGKLKREIESSSLKAAE